jgi:SAM-dependent methyltransferase
VSERFNFEVVDALDYDELRPEYAPEAVAWVAERCGIGPGSRLVDLAAGTGRLSGWFLQLGVDVIAVEPAANMRAVLEERFPTIRAIVATAESMPFDDGAVDAVVVGNAFHHFGRDAAMAEIHRILRPGGALAVFWAWPAEEEQLKIPGMRAIYEAIDDTHAEAEIVVRAAGHGGRVRPVRAPGVPRDPRPAGGAARGPLRDLQRCALATRSHPSVVARPHQAAVARTPRDAASPPEDRRRSLRRSVS